MLVSMQKATISSFPGCSNLESREVIVVSPIPSVDGPFFLEISKVLWFPHIDFLGGWWLFLGDPCRYMWWAGLKVGYPESIGWWSDVFFPLVGWWIEGFEQPPWTTGLFDDRLYTSSRPLYFYQKDIIGPIYLHKPDGFWGIFAGGDGLQKNQRKASERQNATCKDSPTPAWTEPVYTYIYNYVYIYIYICVCVYTV